MSRSLLAVLALWLVWAAVPTASSAGLPVVVFTEFRNNTGDPAWDTLSRGLADMIRSDLDDSSALRIVSRDDLDAILAEQALLETGILDPATAVRVGRGVAASHVFQGSYIVSGQQLRLDAQMVSVETGEQVLSEHVIGDRNDFFGLEAQLIERVHAALGVSQPSLQQLQLSRRAPATLDTLVTYSQALTRLDLGQHEEALVLLQQAIDQAPEFEQAYARKDQIEATLSALMAAREAGLSGAALVAARDLEAYTPGACDTFRQVYKAMLSDIDEARELRRPDQDIAVRLYRTYAVLLYLQELQLPDDPCGLVPPNDAVVTLFLTRALSSVLCSEASDDAHATCIADGLALRDDAGAVVLEPAAYEDLYLSLALDYLKRFPYGSEAQEIGRRAETLARNQLGFETSAMRLCSVDRLAGGSPGRPLEASEDREGGAAWQDHSSHDHSAGAARTGDCVYREDSTPLRSVSPTARAGGLPSGAGVDQDPGGAVWVSAVWRVGVVLGATVQADVNPGNPEPRGAYPHQSTATPWQGAGRPASGGPS